jgi:hypothetical protein
VSAPAAAPGYALPPPGAAGLGVPVQHAVPAHGGVAGGLAGGLPGSGPAAPVALDGTPTAAAAAAALADPLTAPLAAVMGWPLAADPTAPSTATWPCVSCGGRTAIDLDVCSTCATPFGGWINRLEDVKAQRRKVLIISLGVVALFLTLLAAVTLVGTKAPPRAPGPDGSQTVVLDEG